MAASAGRCRLSAAGCEVSLGRRGGVVVVEGVVVVVSGWPCRAARYPAAASLGVALEAASRFASARAASFRPGPYRPRRSPGHPSSLPPIRAATAPRASSLACARHLPFVAIASARGRWLDLPAARFYSRPPIACFQLKRSLPPGIEAAGRRPCDRRSSHAAGATDEMPWACADCPNRRAGSLRQRPAARFGGEGEHHQADRKIAAERHAGVAQAARRSP